MIEFIDALEYKGMQVVIEDDFQLKCKISKDKLNVRVRLEYNIIDKQFELESLRNYFCSFKEETIESLCVKIKKDLSSFVEKLKVTISGTSKKHPYCQVSL